MIGFTIIFLIGAICKIIYDLCFLIKNSLKYEFYLVCVLTLFGTTLFILQLLSVNMPSPLQALFLLFEKMGITYKK